LISVSAQTLNPLSSSQATRITIPKNSLHHKMQRRTASHNTDLYPSPEYPWISSSQLAGRRPRALALISAHHHINQHKVFLCDWCGLRDRLILDIVRPTRLFPSSGPFVHGCNTGNPLTITPTSTFATSQLCGMCSGRTNRGTNTTGRWLVGEERRWAWQEEGWKGLVG
jgi:hypothetical protein